MSCGIRPADDIYVVTCHPTKSGGVYYVGEIKRVPLTVKARDGLFVRYKGGFYPLHCKRELRVRIEELRAGGFFLSARSGSVRRRNEIDSPRDFILDSERLEQYYDPVARKCAAARRSDTGQ
jgi:hypothetical protein